MGYPQLIASALKTSHECTTRDFIFLRLATCVPQENEFLAYLSLVCISLSPCCKP